MRDLNRSPIPILGILRGRLILIANACTMRARVADVCNYVAIWRRNTSGVVGAIRQILDGDQSIQIVPDKTEAPSARILQSGENTDVIEFAGQGERCR